MEGHDGLKSIGPEGGIDAKQLAGAVVVDANDRGLLAVEQHGRGGVSPPHLIGSHGGDRAVMGPWAENPPGLPGCLETVLPHEEADAFYICLDALVAQAGMDLPVTLAHEGRISPSIAGSQSRAAMGFGAALPSPATFSGLSSFFMTWLIRSRNRSLNSGPDFRAALSAGEFSNSCHGLP